MAGTWTALLSTWANKAISIARMNAYFSLTGNMQYLYERVPTLTDIPYSAGNFTSDTGSWTVQEADQTAFCYILNGVQCTLMFSLNTTSISGTPERLYIKMPVTASHQVVTTFRLLDTGTERLGVCYTEADSDVLNLFSPSGTFATSTNATVVQGEIVFPLSE